MKKRLSQLQKAFPEEIGAILITSSVNRRYFTGFPSTAGALLVTRRKSYFITDSRYFEAAEKAVEGCTVLLQESKLAPQIAGLLRHHRVKRLGLEARSVTVSQLGGYREAFGSVAIETDDRVQNLLERQRMIKSPQELDCMRAAQKIADSAFLHILEYVEAGRTERQIAAELETFCRRAGSEGASFSTILASGPNSSVPHASPSDRRLMTGDFVTMDFGCKVGGYCSDMTRTVALGSVSPRQRECYETVLAAQLAAMEMIRAGVLCAAVDRVARDIIDASEFKGRFVHGLGHSLGLEIHEEPRFNATSETVLEAGMVLSVEPGVYLAGEFGVRIEDCVIVTKDGCENLASSPKDLIIL